MRQGHGQEETEDGKYLG
jgi:hypothetical protein